MTASTSTSQIAENLNMQGRALRLAQVVWIALVILLLGVFIAALPPYFSFLQTTCITPYQTSPEDGGSSALLMKQRKCCLLVDK